MPDRQMPAAGRAKALQMSFRSMHGRLRESMEFFHGREVFAPGVVNSAASAGEMEETADPYGSPRSAGPSRRPGPSPGNQPNQLCCLPRCIFFLCALQCERYRGRQDARLLRPLRTWKADAGCAIIVCNLPHLLTRPPERQGFDTTSRDGELSGSRSQSQEPVRWHRCVWSDWMPW